MSGEEEGEPAERLTAHTRDAPTQVGEVQEGDDRKDGTDAHRPKAVERPRAERVPATRRLGLPLLQDEGR